MADPNDEWHRSKITVISMVLSMLMIVGGGIWAAGNTTATITSGFAQQHKTLTEMNTKLNVQSGDIADLKERVLRNEIMLSEQGKLLSDIKKTLEKFDTTIDRINIEQQKRTSVIDRSKEHLNEHKHGDK